MVVVPLIYLFFIYHEVNHCFGKRQNWIRHFAVCMEGLPLAWNLISPIAHFFCIELFCRSQVH